MKPKTLRSKDREITVGMLPKFLHEVKFKRNRSLEKYYGWISRNDLTQMMEQENKETEYYLQVGLAMHQYLKNVIDKLSRRRLEDHPVDRGSYFKEAPPEAREEAKEKAHQILSHGIVGQLEEVWGTECPLYFDKSERRVIDLVGIHKNQLTIIDFKSSQHIFVDRDKSIEQVINYAWLHNLYSKRKIEKCIVMIYDKDGYREIIVKEEELNFDYENVLKSLFQQGEDFKKAYDTTQYKISNLLEHKRNSTR